jgi:hypothetical protein
MSQSVLKATFHYKVGQHQNTKSIRWVTHRHARTRVPALLVIGLEWLREVLDVSARREQSGELAARELFDLRDVGVLGYPRVCREVMEESVDCEEARDIAQNLLPPRGLQFLEGLTAVLLLRLPDPLFVDRSDAGDVPTNESHLA